MALVRLPPLHSAVMSASVVGKAIPAATPPPSRARASTSIDGAHAATRLAGTDRAMPSMTICLRP